VCSKVEGPQSKFSGHLTARVIIILSAEYLIKNILHYQ
jgi:hypothetical protein